VNRFLAFCEYLIKEGNAKNYTEIARSVGISPSMMTDIKKARTRIGQETIAGIAKAYPDLNLLWLLTGFGEMFSNPTGGDLEGFSNHITNVGKRLKSVREHFHFSKREMNMLYGGQHPDTVTHAEIGAGISNDCLANLLSNLPVSRQWILTGDGEMLLNNSSPESALVKEIHRQRNIAFEPGLREADSKRDDYKVISLNKSNELIEISDNLFVEIMPLVDIDHDREFTESSDNLEYLSGLSRHCSYLSSKPGIEGLRYVAFRNRGNDMTNNSSSAILDKDILIGTQIPEISYYLSENLNDSGIFIVVHKDKILVRKLKSFNKKSKALICYTMNEDKGLYPDLTIKLDEIKQLFKVKRFERVLK